MLVNTLIGNFFISLEGEFRVSHGKGYIVSGGWIFNWKIFFFFSKVGQSFIELIKKKEGTFHAASCKALKIEKYHLFSGPRG